MISKWIEGTANDSIPIIQDERITDDVSATLLERLRENVIVEAFTDTDIVPERVTGTTAKTIKLVDSLLAKEFTKLSIGEREKTYEELHGVDEVIPETTEFVHQNLMAIDREIEKIQVHDKPAYMLAMKTSESYVKDPKFRLMFLRAEYFHPQRAAQRLVAFFEGKLKYFGEERLTKPIRYCDLDEDDKSCLNKGQMQILPTRDRAGRLVHCQMNQIKDVAFKDPRNLIRSFIYLQLTLAEDEENQKRGIVTILFQLGSVSPKDMNRELAREGPRIGNWLPIKVAGIHICTDNPVVEVLARVILAGSTPALRSRHRLHYGTHTELMYKLMSYGIPVEHFPINEAHVIKKTNFSRWLSRRRTKEQRIDRTGEFAGVDLPTRYDILAGTGRPINRHPGNVWLRSLVDQYMEEYTSAKKGSKSVVIMRVVDEVKSSSGRFLSRDQSGWWFEVPDSEAKAKVAKAFLTAGTKKNRDFSDIKLPDSPVEKRRKTILPHACCGQ